MSNGVESNGELEIAVVIVDDQRVIRDGLTMLVGFLTGVRVVGSAANGAEAIAVVRKTRPDIVLMDLRMPEMDGVEATQAIVGEQLAAVIVLTTYADDESLFPALQAGASGYLTKDASAEQIETAILAVHRGETWLDPIVQQRLVSAVTTNPARLTSPVVDPDHREQRPAALPDGLTAREAEVLACIAEGLSNPEIGTRLYLGQATVKTHINRIFSKTGVRDRAQAVRYAFDHGITDLPR